VYTDRALNHMSAPFMQVMNDLNVLLKGVYGAAATVILPGSGTFGMEAAARQFATGKAAAVESTTAFHSFILWAIFTLSAHGIQSP